MTVVVVYVLDSLRADVLECYGAPVNSTPNLAEIASESTVFTNAFSQSSWTRPSGASILSSTYPSFHGVNSVNNIYPANLPTMASELSEAGFTTVGITAMGNIAPNFGFDVGFDDFRTLYNRPEIVDRNLSVEANSVGWEDHFGSSNVGIATGEDINSEIADCLNTYSGDLFLFVWSLDTHDPYFHRDPDTSRFTEVTDDEPIWNYEIEGMNNQKERKYIKRLYKDMVHYADKQIGDLVELLESQGRYEETCLILTGDHGEAFGEHGENGHKKKPYHEQVHIPLIVKTPLDHDKSLVNNMRTAVVESVDIYPTICEEFGEGYDSNYVCGENLFKSQNRDMAFIELFEQGAVYQALRTDSIKYIQKQRQPISFNGFKRTATEVLNYIHAVIANDEVYLLNEDPDEKYNAIDNYDTTNLREEIDRYRQSIKDSDGIQSETIHNMDSDVESQLEQLGYLK